MNNYDESTIKDLNLKLLHKLGQPENIFELNDFNNQECEIINKIIKHSDTLMSGKDMKAYIMSNIKDMFDYKYEHTNANENEFSDIMALSTQTANQITKLNHIFPTYILEKYSKHSSMLNLDYFDSNYQPNINDLALINVHIIPSLLEKLL